MRTLVRIIAAIVLSIAVFYFIIFVGWLLNFIVNAIPLSIDGFLILFGVVTLTMYIIAMSM